MLAICVVTISVITFLIVSYILYNGGYKEDGILLRNATYGVVIFYVLLVLMIGLAPIE